MKSKGYATLPIVALFALITTGYFIYNLTTANQPNVDYVGETTQLILETIERQERAFQFLDETVRHASHQAIQQQLNTHGFKSEAYIDNNCEELVHPVIGSRCAWKTTKHLESLTQQELRQRKQKNPYVQTRLLDLQTNATVGSHVTVNVTSEQNVTMAIQEQPPGTTTTLQGQTPFGEKIVKIQGLNNIDCGTGQSCTGLDRRCKTKPEVYNALKELDAYIDKHSLDITGEITQATRSWEMQHRLYRAAEICQGWKQTNCANTDTSRCENSYVDHVSNLPGNYCSLGGVCKACDPGDPSNPNKGCSHMTGDSVDIHFTTPQGTDINNQYTEALRNTMCKFDLKNTVASEDWHYEHKPSACPDNPTSPFLHQVI